jgi:hypothetical protein
MLNEECEALGMDRSEMMIDAIKVYLDTLENMPY